MSSGLGVSLTLPTSTIQRLIEKRDGNLAKIEKGENEPSEKIEQHLTTISHRDNGHTAMSEDCRAFKDATTHDSDQHSVDSSLLQSKKKLDSEEDFDDTIIPFKIRDDVEEDDAEEASQKEDDNGSDSDDDSVISLSPPPYMPIIVVDLNKLNGSPIKDEELQRVKEMIEEELLGAVEDGKPSNHSTNFVSRSSELFELGIAIHSDSIKSAPADNTICAFPYPEYVSLPSGILSTSLVWKRILHPSSIVVVERVLCRLRETSRDISWKFEMNIALRDLVKKECFDKEHRERSAAVKEWKTARSEKLDKLYQVREAFERKIDEAKDKYSCLVEQREDKVAKELAIRRAKGGDGGVAQMDLEGGVDLFNFQETLQSEEADDAHRQWFGLNKDEYQDKSDSAISEDSVSGEISDKSYSDSEEEIYVHMKTPSPLESTKTSLPTINPKSRKKARMVASAKRRKKRLVAKMAAEKNAAKVASQKARMETAKAEEKDLHESFKSMEEKMAQAIMMGLEKRLVSIDELLDSLQEEEWEDQDEEEGDEEADKRLNLGQYGAEEGAEENTFSLLDQILAMILGTVPNEFGDNVEKHFSLMRKEHLEIVTDWKEYFGRLPSQTLSGRENETTSEDIEKVEMSGKVVEVKSRTKEEMMSELGIADNDDDDWDDAEDLDDTEGGPKPDQHSKDIIATQHKTEDSKLGNATSKAGLRPGGRTAL